MTLIQEMRREAHLVEGPDGNGTGYMAEFLERIADHLESTPIFVAVPNGESGIYSSVEVSDYYIRENELYNLTDICMIQPDDESTFTPVDLIPLTEWEI